MSRQVPSTCMTVMDAFLVTHFVLFFSCSNEFDNQTTNIIFTACGRGGWKQCWKTTFDPLSHMILSLTVSSCNHNTQLTHRDSVLSF